MKKYLLLNVAICISLSIIAAPWDMPIKKCKIEAFTPYVTSYGAFIISQPGQPNYAVQIQITMSASVPAPWLVTVQVYGNWVSQPGGASYRTFNIYFTNGQWKKTVNFPMSVSEEAFTSLIDELYEGPY